VTTTNLPAAATTSQVGTGSQYRVTSTASTQGSETGPTKISGKAGSKRKRQKRDDVQEVGDLSETESDEDDGIGMSGGISVGMGGLGVPGKGGKREKSGRL